MRKAIEPVGESKSDYEAIVEVAKKLGMLDRGDRGLLGSGAHQRNLRRA